MKDQAVAGVLHQPFAPSEKEGRTVWALVGFGVFGLKQRPTPNPEKSRIMLLPGVSSPWVLKIVTHNTRPV